MADIVKRAEDFDHREIQAGGPEVLIHSLVKGVARLQFFAKVLAISLATDMLLTFGLVTTIYVVHDTNKKADTNSSINATQAKGIIKNQNDIKINEDGLRHTDFEAALHNWQDCNDYRRAIQAIIITHEAIMSYIRATDPPTPALVKLLSSDSAVQQPPNCGGRPVEGK
jgi:hypothetical protein